MADARHEPVEVVYALPQVQRIVRVPYRAGLTAGQAVQESGLLESVPEIERQPLVLGCFGHEISPSQAVAPGERIEISRPLIRDPRELRRELLKHGLVMGPAARGR